MLINNYKICVLMYALLFSSNIFAADVIPNTVQPGYIERQQTPTPALTDKPEAIIVPQSQNQLIPAEASSIKFKLLKVTLTGNNVIETNKLEPLWASKLNKENSLLDIYELAQQLTTYYRNQGFILTQVIVPPQDIINGEVKLEVIEGHIDEIEIKDANGQTINNEKLIPFLKVITDSKPLKDSVLERQLLLINDMAGIQAKAYLQPSKTHGASKLTLITTQYKFSGSIGANNRISELLGNVQFDIGLNASNLFGLYERNSLRGLATDEGDMRFLSYSGDFPLGSSGLKLLPNLSYSKSTPNINSFSKLETVSKTASLFMSYPVIRGRERNLSIRGGISTFDSNTELDGFEIDSYKLRTLRAGFSFDIADKYRGINLLDLELSKGINGLGALDDLNNNGNNLNFTKMTFFASRLQYLAPGFSMLIAANGQYSDDILLSAERVGFGGDSFLRAYDPSELLGDSGLAAKLELRYNFNWSRAFFTAYTFAETGQVWVKNFNAPDTEDDASTIGLGLRFTVLNNLNGYLEIDKPIGRDVVQDKNRDTRAFASISYSF